MQGIIAFICVSILGAACGDEPEPNDHLSRQRQTQARSSAHAGDAEAAEGDFSDTSIVYVAVVTDIDPPGAGIAHRSPDRPMLLRGSWMQLEAVALPGYCFVGWRGDLVAEAPIVRFRVETYSVIWATFSACFGG